jgi:hypothetical protein
MGSPTGVGLYWKWWHCGKRLWVYRTGTKPLFMAGIITKTTGMSKREFTRLDFFTIVVVAICISALIWGVKSYIEISESPKDQCWYEIKYLHVSGREITKRVYMTCEGFYPWYADPQRYKVPAMVLPFSDGNQIVIQGATDILSVAKIKDYE